MNTPTKEIVIFVRPKDITEGKEGNCWKCPIAIAVRRRIVEPCAVVVNGYELQIDAYIPTDEGFDFKSHTLLLQKTATNFIHDFDFCEEVQPILFRLTLPIIFLK